MVSVMRDAMARLTFDLMAGRRPPLACPRACMRSVRQCPLLKITNIGKSVAQGLFSVRFVSD